jgi:uncharacterized protein YcbX
MPGNTAKVAAIYRYPIKGFSPEPLSSVKLAMGETLPADRRYAVENGPSGFDPTAPAYFPKIKFLMLMKNERLARLKTRYDDASDTLTIREDGKEIVRGALGTPEGRATIEAFLAKYCADELRGPPKVLRGNGHSFSDVARKVVSLINLASVAALEAATGVPVDPLRFRANLYVEGWPAWHEFDLLDQDVTIGPFARARVIKRIVRCAATNVDPQTGIRDLEIPKTLTQTFGHQDLGVYLHVVTPGLIAAGNTVEAAR